MLPERNSKDIAEKSKLRTKSWQDFVAELQLFLLSRKEFNLKFADK
jgi:hypothetical protein